MLFSPFLTSSNERPKQFKCYGINICVYSRYLLIYSKVVQLRCQGSENESKIYVCTSRSQLLAKADLCSMLNVIDTEVDFILS